MTAPQKSGISQVYLFFSDNKGNGYTLQQFQRDWKELDEKGRDQLRSGVLDGTFDYAV